MSLKSPPGDGGRWSQLLAFIVDDDDRTRRANLLLRNISACLLVIGGTAAAMPLLAAGPGRYTMATGSVVVLLLRLARARRQR
jgi:hypothetical protein